MKFLSHKIQSVKESIFPRKKVKEFTNSLSDNLFFGWDGYEAVSQSRIRDVQNPKGQGTVARFTLFPTDLICKGNRVEVKKYLDYPAETEAFYEFEILIPKNYRETEENNWQVLAQWLYQPDSTKGHTWDTGPEYDPPVAITYGKKRGKPTLTLRYGVKDNSLDPIATTHIKKGEWYNIRLQIKWSLSKKGSIMGWVNSKPWTVSKSKVQKVYGQNMYNPLPNCFKIGLYGYYGTQHKNSVYFRNVVVKPVKR